jgi:hypothetical protein
MAKSKKKKRKHRENTPTEGISAGTRSTGKRRLILAGLMAVTAVIGGWSWWQARGAEAAFLALAAAGQEGLNEVETRPNRGRGHPPPGTLPPYEETFPTSGPHDPTWVEPGTYEMAQATSRLVHALEHGNIVIYYDKPGAEVLDTLADWADIYDGNWSGLVIAPHGGLGDTIVLTAWRKILRMKTFDPAPAAAFIDAFRGRGPEHPVR